MPARLPIPILRLLRKRFLMSELACDRHARLWNKRQLSSGGHPTWTALLGAQNTPTKIMLGDVAGVSDLGALRPLSSQ
jgi:hypothetical protein